MARREDHKLTHLSETLVGDRCSQAEIVRLARTGDLVGLGAGSVVHRETDADRWSYVLLDGTVAVSQNGDPLAVAAPGTWFPLGPVHGKATRARISLTAMTDVELLAFRWQELVALAKDIPALVAV